MLSDYNQSLYKSLSDLGIIDQKQLDEAFKISEESRKYLGKILTEKDLINDEDLGKVMADIFSLPLANLTNLAVKKDILDIIPEVVAKKQKIIAFKRDQRGLHIAMADPSSLEAVEFIKKKTGEPVILYFATENDLENALSLYAEDIKEAFERVITENIRQVKGKGIRIVEGPIVKIVDIIIRYAYRNRTSDIHIEPKENDIMVRFRIDGVLHDILKLPLELHTQIVTRVKVLSKLRTDEHQSAQDGRMQYEVEDGNVDIRVSIVPVTGGEKVVMRLLSERSRQFFLSNLGFAEENLQKLKNAYEKPFGLILSTGPTGSGKTTTLYAVMKILNRKEVNIMTIEDPVEYDVDGINQIQVNPKTNLTFTSGLRSIVRQDPDIILVGEIRDSETAGIAINSAMTGHLVLSTLHTNDAATTIPRLIDMKVEPFLVASSVNAIIGQRLIRKICLKCRTSKEIALSKFHLKEVNARKILGAGEKIRVYYGKGCASCHETGFEGRIGIFEILEISDNVRQAIIERKDAETIKQIAISEGMKTMNDDGLEKVKQGITTIEEVMRATKE